MKTVELSPFGVALREAIDASPFKNRSAFLAAAGTQPPVLYRYETGEQSPRLDQISEWAALLRCDPEQLIPFVRRDRARDTSDDYQELEAFLATDFGKQTTAEERRTLAVLVARHGRPQSHETFERLVVMLRLEFERSTAPVLEAKTGTREKHPPASSDRAARPRKPAKKSSTR